jgi:hypothetical protein
MIYLPDVALDCLCRLRAGRPESASMAAAALIEAGKLQAGADLLASAISKPDADPDDFLALALIAYMVYDHDLCASLADGSIQRGGGAGAFLLAGAAHICKGRLPQAVSVLRAALHADGGFHRAHSLLWTALDQMGRLPDLLAAVKRRLARIPPAASPADMRRVEIEGTTLCIVDCVNHALAARALALSMRGCAFERVKYISDAPCDIPGVENIAIAPLRSAADYSRFIAKGLLAHVDTDYVLIIQWDGYVTNPAAWSPEFLLYDYIGARWNNDFGRNEAHHNVGNGGFSLRSRALLEALQDPAISDLHPEDGAICRRYRSYLEERHGSVFATDDMADRFSFEHIIPPGPTFGFHGPTNLARFVDTADWAALDFFFAAADA